MKQHDLYGRQVFIYKNLHKSSPGKPVYSVRDERSGRVIAHAEHALIASCKFVVQPGGRARVIAGGKKNVHAGVRGRLVSLDPMLPLAKSTQITYDPYRFDSFVRRTDESRIERAPWAYIGPTGVVAGD